MADLLGDAAWANSRLGELLAERERLAGARVVSGEPPQIDAKTALACRRQTEKVLAQGDAAERKRLVRTWVQEMKQAPGRLEVEITYRIPEPVLTRAGGAGPQPTSPASASSSPIRNTLGPFNTSVMK